MDTLLVPSATGAGVLIVLCLWVLVGALTLAMPVMALVTTLNLRRIRQQFELLNETLGSKMTITKSGPLGL